MAGFNKFPLREGAGAVDGAASGPFSNFNVKLERSTLGPGEFDERNITNAFEGFNSDGDRIELPTAAAVSLEYFNAAGASQFTVARTAIAAASDDWVGPMFDKQDGLIYVVVVDEGTSPNTYFLASIDSAGTIVNIGNDQPSSDFTTTATTWYNTAAVGTNGASMIQRQADGLGNIFVRQTNAAGFEEMEIDITNGSIVSDPATVAGSQLAEISWRTKDGHYQSFPATIRPQFKVSGGAETRSLITDQQNNGYPTVTTGLVQWKGNAVVSRANASSEDDARVILSSTEYDLWVKNSLIAHGMIAGTVT